MRIEELKKAVNKNAVKVLVGFQYRFHPTLNRMKEILLAGEIGEVVSARAHWGEYLPNWHPWEDYRNSYAARPDLGGGVVLTLCHPFDYLRWLIGEVESLWAFTSESASLPTGSESIAEIGVTFSNNATGSIHLDYLQQPGSHTLDIIGTKGSLRWDNSTGELKCFQSSTNKWISFVPPEGYEKNWLFIEEMKAFLSYLRGETNSPCTLDDGIKALEIALAIHRSAAEKSLMKLGR
jgi:predicted dehydrogenase